MLNIPTKQPREFELLTALHEALEVFALFAPEHPRCQERLNRLEEIVSELLAAYGGELVLGIVDDALVVGEARFAPRERGLTLLREKLQAACVHHLTLSNGVRREELLALLTVLIRKAKGGDRRDVAHELAEAGVAAIRCEDSFGRAKVLTIDAGKRSPWRLVRRLDDTAYWHVFDAIKFLRNTVRNREIPSAYPIKAAIDVLLDALLNRPDELVATVFRPQKDDWVLAHAVRSCILALRLGTALTGDRSTLALLAESMLLNDIGLFTIPSAIVYKEGPLTRDEQDTVKMHAVAGAGILLTGAGFAPSTVEATLLHHIDQQGGGYPPVTATTKPSVVCKIVRIVDAYECMVGGRPYRAPRSPFEAAGVLLREAGTSFDAALVRTFIQTIGLAPVGCLAVLSTGAVAEVIEHTPWDLIRPTVVPLLDEDGNPVPAAEPLDLMQTRATTVADTLPLDMTVDSPLAQPAAR